MATRVLQRFYLVVNRLYSGRELPVNKRDDRNSFFTKEHMIGLLLSRWLTCWQFLFVSTLYRFQRTQDQHVFAHYGLG